MCTEIDRLMLKRTWKMQRAKISKSNLKTKRVRLSQTRSLTVTLQYRGRKAKMNKESNGAAISGKQWGKDGLFHKCAGSTEYPHETNEMTLFSQNSTPGRLCT